MAVNQTLVVVIAVSVIVLGVAIFTYTICRRPARTQTNTEQDIPLTVNARHSAEQRAYLRDVRERTAADVEEGITAQVGSPSFFNFFLSRLPLFALSLPSSLKLFYSSTVLLCLSPHLSKYLNLLLFRSFCHFFSQNILCFYYFAHSNTVTGSGAATATVGVIRTRRRSGCYDDVNDITR